MAKLFNKKKEPEKKKDSGGIRFLTEEESRKADRMKTDLTREGLRDLLRAMGKSEKEVMEAVPDPLPEAEQQKKLLELRKLFSSHDYRKVIDVFEPVAQKGLLSGEIDHECRFALGFSGLMLKDKDIINRYGPSTISYFMVKIDTLGDVGKTLGTMQYLINLGEQEVPGCMQDICRRLYPPLVNMLGEDHEFTREVKGYM